MKKTLEFSVQIPAPRSVVWDTMVEPATYVQWASEFCEGSHFKGSWAEGEKIQFLASNGDGMSSEIAENRLHEFISIRHVGEIAGGVEDLSSDKIRSWAPAYENYTFADVPGGTEVRVSIEVVSEWEGFMLETFPKALQKLKTICEGSRGASVDA